MRDDIGAVKHDECLLIEGFSRLEISRGDVAFARNQRDVLNPQVMVVPTAFQQLETLPAADVNAHRA